MRRREEKKEEEERRQTMMIRGRGSARSPSSVSAAVEEGQKAGRTRRTGAEEEVAERGGVWRKRFEEVFPYFLSFVIFGLWRPVSGPRADGDRSGVTKGLDGPQESSGDRL